MEDKMKIVLLGATGRVGSCLLQAALSRGHTVLAIARHPENITTTHENLEVKNVNIFDENVLSEELQGKDALVSCLGDRPSLFNRREVTIYLDSVKVFSSALRKSGVNRLIVMSAWYFSGDVPFRVKVGRFLGFQNLTNNGREMEEYLEQHCSDLDYTAVKMCMGKGQEETEKPVLTHEGEYVPGAGNRISYGDVSKFIVENCFQRGEWKKKRVAIAT